MPDYNLYGLDSRTFQQLVQSLCVKELGPGVIVFGDGADGGRDAAFNGQVSYPSGSDNWDGYIIIQAKYRKVPFGDTTAAGRWVVSQLEDDLKKFVDDMSGRYKPPDYYLFVTNVDFTPDPVSGSDAKVRALLEEYAPKLNLSGFDAWDGHKIASLLNCHRDIARAFGGFITAGDVLGTMMDLIGNLSPDFGRVMSDFLQTEIAGPEQFARLQEAGSAAQQKTKLASVFVDLPVTDSDAANAPFNEPEGEDESPGFVCEILEVGSLRLDQESVNERIQSKHYGDTGLESRGRFVLIGGPGQGKSTVGQFVCQLFRASILNGYPRNRLSVEAREAIESIKSRCGVDGLHLPSAKRFPVRIDLKAFADELASNKCVSLIDFIARLIDRRSARQVDRDDLDQWLAQYPWLLILDGLDEVPAAGNRDFVLEQIQQFSAQLATRSADVLLLATSRPQGYGAALIQPTIVIDTFSRSQRHGHCTTHPYSQKLFIAKIPNCEAISLLV